MDSLEKLVKENRAKKTAYVARCARESIWRKTGWQPRRVKSIHATWKAKKFIIHHGSTRTMVGKISQHIKVIRWTVGIKYSL